MQKMSILGTIRSIWLASVILGTAAIPALGQRQWVRFDGGVESSPGLSFSFARPTPVYDFNGGLLSPDIPRWAPPTLFCGLPESEILSTGSTTNVIAAGVDVDGATPIYVVKTPTFQRLSIHTGESSVDAAFRDDDWSDAYILGYKDVSKLGKANILVEQTGENDGSADVPDKAFGLTDGATVHYGLIVLGSDVLQGTNGVWQSRQVGLAFTTSARLGMKDPWIIAAVGVPTDIRDARRGSPWSFSAFPVSEDELVVVWTDYRGNVKTGGICYATRFLRVGGQWTHETIRVARSETPARRQHWHCGGLIRHADGRETVVVSTGDGIEDNYLLVSTRAAGGAWSSGVPYEGSGIDERSRVYAPSDAWTTPAIVWGGVGNNPPRRHNQVITMVPADANLSELLCGTDETNAVMLRLQYDPNTQIPTWTTAYLPAVTSSLGDGTLVFSLRGSSGGPYLGRIDAATVAEWDADQREARVIFSPDGEHWGQFFSAGTAEHRQVVFSETMGYIGSGVSEEVGLRRFSLPFYSLAQPLVIGPSRQNLMRTDMAVPSEGVDPGVTISALDGVENLPVGVPAPPCDPSNIFQIENYSTTGKLGLWRPVSDFQDTPAPVRFVLVRAWVYALRSEASGHPQATTQLALNLRDSEGEHINFWTGRSEFESGAWMPITIWGKWIGALDISDPLRPGEPWLPEVFLRVERDANRKAHGRFLIAWEGLYLDTPTVLSNGLPASTDGAVEEATIEGLSLSDEWSILLVGMLPDDQWDNRVGGTGEGGAKTMSNHLPTLFSLEDSASGDWFRFRADPPCQGVLGTIVNGSTNQSYAETFVIYWLRQSPVTVLVRSSAGHISVEYSVGGSIRRSFSLPGALTPDRVRLGPDSFWWRSVEAVPYALRDDLVSEVFEKLALPCLVDFNGDGLVDTQDIIAFLAAWTSGSVNADFNADGEINSLDVLAFLSAYTEGC